MVCLPVCRRPRLSGLSVSLSAAALFPASAPFPSGAWLFSGFAVVVALTAARTTATWLLLVAVGFFFGLFVCRGASSATGASSTTDFLLAKGSISLYQLKALYQPRAFSRQPQVLVQSAGSRFFDRFFCSFFFVATGLGGGDAFGGAAETNLGFAQGEQVAAVAAQAKPG